MEWKKRIKKFFRRKPVTINPHFANKYWGPRSDPRLMKYNARLPGPVWNAYHNLYRSMARGNQQMVWQYQHKLMKFGFWFPNTIQECRAVLDRFYGFVDEG